MVKRFLLPILLVMLCMLPLAANGSGEDAGSSSEEVELRFSWWGGDSRHEATLAAIEKFEAANPNVSIIPEYTGWSGHLEKITTQISGGTAPDLMQINWPWLATFSRDGNGFYDLNELSDIVDLSNYSASTLAPVTTNGKVQGVPLSIAGRLMWFNKTTFDKAGIPIPSTFNELIAAGNTFKRVLGDDYYPYHLGWEEAWLTMNLYITQKYGKTFLNPETNQVQVTVAEMKDAFEMYQTMIDNHVAMTIEDNAKLAADAVHQTPNWIDGRIAGLYQWDSAINKSAGNLEEGQELVLAPTFLKFEGATNAGMFFKPSMLFCVNKDSENAEVAAELLQFIVGETEGIDAMNTQRGTPANMAAEKRLADTGMLEGLSYEGHMQVMEFAGDSKPQSKYFEDANIKDLAKDTIELYGFGQLTTDEAAKQLIEGAKTVMEELL